MPATAIHRVLHAGSGPAVTLHAYSPPLTRTGAYWLGPDGELRRISQAAEQELRPALASGRGTICRRAPPPDPRVESPRSCRFRLTPAVANERSCLQALPSEYD
ncbi:MAG: hypothetical protein JO240_02605 [Solirubrobacterales bacterium]|nr:hypothetical protein [Solirubrobacterales bacterium]